jgi:uncharacterized protein (DUF885 family)
MTPFSGVFRKPKLAALAAAILFVAAVLTLTACDLTKGAKHYTEAEQKAESDKLYAFFQQTFDEDVAESPLTQTFFGLKTNNDKIDDFSDAQNIHDHDQDLARLKRLDEFNADALTEAAKLSFKLYKLQTERSIEQFTYRWDATPITQFFGWHSQFPAFMANYHTVDNVADAEAYIARLNESQRVFGQIVDDLKIREAKGVTPPNWVHPLVVETIDNILTGAPFDQSGRDNDFLADFKRKVAALDIPSQQKDDLVARATAALVGNVGPAYRALRDFIAGQQARASADDGVWRLPDGEAYYNSLLKNYTTTGMTAAEIHQMGLENVERIHGEMRAIMAKVGFEGSLQDFFAFMRSDPQFYYPNTDAGRDAYLKKATEIIDTMRAKLPAFFGILPKSGIIVKRVEPFREKSAGKAFYSRPSQDGTRPGIYYVNLYAMEDMPKYQMEALAYHEGIPGHHMQIAISLELEGLPEFQKQSGFTAYTEGWGLYAELLGKDMGFYQDPYSDFGRLSMELWRAARLVVDTGIHYKKWTRQQAMQYLRDNTPNPEGDIVSSINRYVVFPGQATAYLIGKAKILELREWAKAELGERFDIRAFHDEVLRHGALPLNVLEDNIKAWVEKVKSSA